MCGTALNGCKKCKTTYAYEYDSDTSCCYEDMIGQ